MRGQLPAPSAGTIGSICTAACAGLPPASTASCYLADCKAAVSILEPLALVTPGFSTT